MKAIGYVRVSSDGQEDNNSFLHQRQEIENYCRKNNIEMAGIIEEVGSGTGGYEKKRPEFAKLLTKVIEKGEADMLITLNMTRFARSTKDALVVHDRLVAAGKHLILLEQKGDTSTPEGRLFFTMLAGFAEYERALIRERMSSGKNIKRATGGYIHGRPGYGFRSQKGMLVSQPTEGLVISEIVELRKQGNGYLKIANTLNKWGRKTKEGKPFQATTVMRILKRCEVA